MGIRQTSIQLLKQFPRILLVCLSVFTLSGVVVVVAGLVDVGIQELKEQLPTHSRANQLRVAAQQYGVPPLVITLKYEDGSRHVLEIPKGARPGEPQYYPLPKMPAGSVTVRVMYSGYGWYLDKDVMVFSDTKELKRKGLLLYFWEFSYLHVVSGRTAICYEYWGNSDEDWRIAEKPPKMSHYPYGRGGNGVYPSGWQENKWQYYGK